MTLGPRRARSSHLSQLGFLRRCALLAAGTLTSPAAENSLQGPACNESAGEVAGCIGSAREGRGLAATFSAVEFAVEAGSNVPEVTRIDGTTDEPFQLLVGAPYTTVTLHYTGTLPGTNSLLSLVPLSMTEARAQAGECAAERLLDVGAMLKGEASGRPSGSTVVWDLRLGLDNVLSASHRRRAGVRVAGRYRLCYTASGSWASGATLIPRPFSSLVFWGALSYPGIDYMKDKRHYCFAGGVRGTNCKVRLAGGIGNTSAASDWTRSFRLTWASTRIVANPREHSCGAAPAVGVLGVGLPNEFVVGGQSGTVFDLGYTTNRWDQRNFWLCYCPAFDADDAGQPCTTFQDYLQQVGYLFIFSVWQTVATIVPATRFDLVVRCGDVNGCSNNVDNRIKVLDPTHWMPIRNTNNFPIWDRRSGCRHRLQSEHYISPPNCVSATECSGFVNGGPHVDTKTFRGLKMDNSVVSGLSEAREFDLCYCNEDCSNEANWFKVGAFHILRAWVKYDQPDPSESVHATLSVVNTPGVLRLATLGNSFPGDVGGLSNSLHTLSQVKLLADNDFLITDADCASKIPPPVFKNHGCSEPAECYPRGWKNDASQVVTFNAKFYYGGIMGQVFEGDPLVQDIDLASTVYTAGMYAVCYCEDDCTVDVNWARVTTLEVRGPHRGQHWAYQTLIPFDLVVRGSSLHTGNRIRILTPQHRCDSELAQTWDQLHIAGQYREFFNASVLTQDSRVWKLIGIASGNPIVGIGDAAITGSTLSFLQDARGSALRELIKARDRIVIGNLTVDYSGVFPYLDPASTSHKDIMSAPWGHEILQPASNDATGKHFLIAATLRHEDGSVPTWSGTLQASWRRTSEEVFEQIESYEAQQGLRICWSDGGTGPGDYVEEAGTLDLQDAPLMAFSSASVAATATGVVTPLILAFRTSASSSSQYRIAENEMELRIELTDQHITLQSADLEGGDLYEGAEGSLDREDQLVCGKFYRELWSSHANGFPVPKGCTYDHGSRRYAIVFDKRNGLAGNTEYQMVLNVVTQPPPGGSPYWETHPAARLFSMDDSVLRKEFAVEVTSCFFRAGRAPGDFGPNAVEQLGFKIVDAISGRASDYVDLTSHANSRMLTFELTVVNGSAPIVAGHFLRLFFFPLTAWRLESPCMASCSYSDGRLCGAPHTSEPTCVAETAVPDDTAQQNVAKLALPSGMDPVNSTVPLRVQLRSLALPAGGLFPARMALEASADVFTRPRFTWSSGACLYVPPQLSFGAVVNTLAGDGNDRPFRGDRLNMLYVRIVLGATLHSQPRVKSGPNGTLAPNRTAAFTVILPADYTLASTGSAPASLRVFGGDVPQGRGAVPDSGSRGGLGDWELRSNVGRFYLHWQGTIFAGSSIFLSLVVNNPVYVLKHADPRNVWYAALESHGEAGNMSEPLVTPPRLFAHGDGYFSRNVAVEGKLAASIAPLIFTPSARTNELHVFLRAEQDAGPRSQVRLFGPVEEPFDFGKRCEPKLLGDRYYVDLGPEHSCLPLPGMRRQIVCEGLQSTIAPSRFYGAFLQLSGRIRAGQQYGFAILVVNPDRFLASQTQEWSIQTYTAEREEIDRTDYTVPFTPRQSERRSFGLYDFQPSQIDVLSSVIVALSSRLPTALTRDTSWAVIGGIQLPKDSVCRLRIVAPELYEWSYVVPEFLYRPGEVLVYLPDGGRLPDGSFLVNAELPTGFIAPPVVAPLNVIAAPGATNFERGARYGLAARIRVPQRPNTASSDSFFVQCGAEQAYLTDRSMAAILDVPVVAALVDVAVGYTTNIVSMTNRLRFRVRTTTDIESTGALRIRGPKGFYSGQRCTVLSTDPELERRLQLAREGLAAYEDLVLQQAAREIALGADSPEVLALGSQVAKRLEELKAEVETLWADRRAARALPLDTGCVYTLEEEVRPFVEITLQVGVPNLNVDIRLGAFARRYLSELFASDSRGLPYLPSGLYEFEVDVVNPSSPRSNGPSSAASNQGVPGAPAGVVQPPPQGCGYEQCWQFQAFAAPLADLSPSDYAAEAAGFAVVTRMREAFLVNLTAQQRRASFRNDRPGQPNQLVFAFMLNKVVPDNTSQVVPGGAGVTRQSLLLRAPVGYEFPEDCSVVVDRALVFGTPGLEPPALGLANWSVEVASCAGAGNAATVAVVGPVGLEPGRRYSFRIDILANPNAAPARNLWSLEFYGRYLAPQELGDERQHAEAAEPFPGFELWTFPSLRVVPRTTERSPGTFGSAGGGAIINMVTVVFGGLNAVPSQGGALRLEAPQNLVWLGGGVESGPNISAGGAATAGASCEAQLLERPAVLPPDAEVLMAAGSIGTAYWLELDVRCTIHAIFANVLWVWLTGARSIKPYTEYALIVSVVNPNVEVTRPGTFRLTSWQPAPAPTGAAASAEAASGLESGGPEGYELLDVASAPGFAITKGLSSLEVSPAGGTTARGGLVTTIRVAAAFVEAVFPNDVLTFTVPPGYMLRVPDAQAADPALQKRCRHVLNRSKPGALPDQVLKCFVGIRCVLRVAGSSLGSESHVQLHRADRACGSLPGRDVDSRRTRVGASSAGVAEYELGLNLAVGHFRVCYCHGDGGCEEHTKFCQDVGNLTITDLCGASACPQAPDPCTTRCNPHTGLCTDLGKPALPLADGMVCSGTDIAGGTCQAGACSAAAPAPQPPPPPPQAANATPGFGTGDGIGGAPASCNFDRVECTNRTLTWTVGHEGYERAATVHLEVAALHPESAPLEDNDFAVEHERGGSVRGGRVIEAYGLQTQLWDVTFTLVGRLRAGGALSDVELRLRAVRAAASLWIRAKQPIGFDFSRAYLPSGGSVLHALGDAIEVLVDVRPREALHFLLRDVRLPPQGGTSLFDVMSFNGSALQDTANDVQGFHTPAHVDVSEVELLNQYKRDDSGFFSMEAGFGNRLAEWAQLRLVFRFSADLALPLRLLVSAPSWSFAPLSAQLMWRKNAGDPSPVSFALSTETRMEQGSADALDMVLSQPLDSWDRRSSYALSVEVLAPGPSSCGCWAAGGGCRLCIVNWTVEVFNHGALVATSDGLLRGFPLVSEVMWEVFANRAPPRAGLDLVVRFSEVGAVHANVLIVTAPVGYEFPYTCLAGDPNNISDTIDLPRFKGCVGRLNTAVLSLESRGLFRPTTLALRVITPRATPADNRWYVEGRLAEGNSQVSWGVTTGLLNEDLQQVSVEYGRFQALQTFFLVRLTSQVEVRNGGSVAVLPPPGYLLTCEGFRHFAMPSATGKAADLACAAHRQGVSVAFRGATLRTATEYSFIVLGGTAAASTHDASKDVFEVRISDQSGRVVEANHEIRAVRLRDFGSIESPFLLWYDEPVAQSTIWATVGLRVPLHAPAGLQGIRVGLPEGLQHGVEVTTRTNSANGVTLVWQPITFEETLPGTFSDYISWRAADRPSSLTAFYEAPNATASSTPKLPIETDERRWLRLGRRSEVEVSFRPEEPFPAGELLVLFPVKLPKAMPAVNAWRVSLVFADDSVPASFVLPGFAFGEASDPAYVRHARHLFQQAGLSYFAFSNLQANFAAHARGILLPAVLLLLSLPWSVGLSEGARSSR